MFHLKLCEIYVTLKDEKTRMKKFGDIFILIKFSITIIFRFKIKCA